MKARFSILLLIVLIVSAVFTACGSETENTNTESPTDSSEPVAEEPAETEPSGPIPFSEVGTDMMTANDTYSEFTFEEGNGTCMEQGFPTDMVYDAENIMKTGDGSYVEDWTAIDFTGRISFDDVTLTDGAAACVMQTVSGSDDATVTCSIDEQEVCTASFKVFAHM